MKKNFAVLWCLIFVSGLISAMFLLQHQIQAANQLKVQFYNGNTLTSTNTIYLNFKLMNQSPSSIPLSSVTMRYYFKEENTSSTLAFFADDASIGAGNVTGTFHPYEGPWDDRYCEVGFLSSAGSIAPGGEVTVQARIVKQDFGLFQLQNDYSFNIYATSYEDWEKVTGYVNGSLSWGREPATPTPTAPPISYWNVAAGQPVTCSSQLTGFEASKAVDGDTLNTHWAGTGFPQWLQVDLGSNYYIRTLSVNPYQSRPYQYIVELSTDGVNYTQVVDRTGVTEGSQVFSNGLYPDFQARYARLTILGVYGGITNEVAINEFEVTGTSVTPTAIPTATPTPTRPPDGFHIITGPVDNVSNQSALLTAHLSTDSTRVDVWYEYWETANPSSKYTTVVQTYDIQNHSPYIINQRTITGLLSNTSYTYQACARSQANLTKYGGTRSFTTLAAPTPTPAPLSTITLEAENCDSSSGVTIAGTEVISFDDGDWICFKNVNFDAFHVPTPPVIHYPEWRFTIRAKIFHTYDTVPKFQIRLDQPDGVNYSLDLTQTDVYQDYTIIVSQVSGTHDLYIKLTGMEDIGCLDYVRINFSYRTEVGGPTPTQWIQPTPSYSPGPAMEPVLGVTAISAGYSHSLAYRNSNAAMAWGDNSSYQICNLFNPRINPHTMNLTGIKTVNAGYKNSAAIKLDETLWMWGLLGYQITSGKISFTIFKDPVQISGLTGVSKVAGGRAHQVALLSNGTVWTWWENTYSQLGNGSGDHSLNPVQVSGLTGIIDIASGYDHALALKSDGTVWTWGYNHYYQLGDGSNINRNIPVQVNGLAQIMAIAGGGGHSAALDRNGTVWTWGSNFYGQLGDGTTQRKQFPVQVPGLTGISAIAAGMKYMMALKNDGTVWAWGDGSMGQLGNGSSSGVSSIPVQVTGLTGVSEIKAGGYFGLVRKNDNTVWAWGNNGTGQLGISNYTTQSLPVQAGSPVVSLTPTGTPTPTMRVTPTPTQGITVTPTPTPRRVTTTPTPTRRRVTITPTPTRRVTPSPTPTPTVSGGYMVSYVIQSDWGSGATISVTIKNNTTTAVNGWTLAWTFPGNQTISNLWNGTYTQSGASVSVRDAGHNANIPANGGSVNFGFNLNYSGANAKPSSFTLNGTACQVQ